MTAEVALSTMWGIGPFRQFGDFFKTGQAIGFDRFELNHGVDSHMLAAMQLGNGYYIASVHEPCPADISVGALKDRNWLVSALDERDRQEGVCAIKRSIELAQRVGASTVIVHPGRVDIDNNLEMRVHQMYRERRSNSADYNAAKQKLMDVRRAQAGLNMQSVRRSLGEIAEYASVRSIQLGLENRYHYHEIPLPDELEELLGLGYSNVGYWHDVGHAQVLANLGFGEHEEWLRRFSGRIVGVHLHDVIGIDDHRAAGTGDMDWDMVARHIPAQALRTCEFQNNNSPRQVQEGVAFLIRLGIVTG